MRVIVLKKNRPNKRGTPTAGAAATSREPPKKSYAKVRKWNSMEIFAIFNLVLFDFCFSILFIVSRIIEIDWQQTNQPTTECIHTVFTVHSLSIQIRTEITIPIQILSFCLCKVFSLTLSFRLFAFVLLFQIANAINFWVRRSTSSECSAVAAFTVGAKSNWTRQPRRKKNERKKERS